MDNLKKKICLILPAKLPVPNIKGGAIETLITLLLDQNEIDNKVHFIVISAWSENIEKLSKRYKNTEFHYFHVRKGIWKKGINLINYIISITTGNIDFFKSPMHYDIEKIIEQISADEIVVEHGVYKHFGFLKKYYSKEHLYLHLHGTGPMPDRETTQTFGHVIAVSDFVKKFYMPGFNKQSTQFHVCLNGIDDTIFKRKISLIERTKIRKSFNVMERDFLVIYCGRLVREKGVKELVRGVIETNNPHIKLMIVGGSNFQDSKKTKYITDLQNLIKGYDNQIFFTGYISNEQLYKYYQAADLQAICSISEEAAGLVGIEGMMSGLPLIITDSGGIQEYISPDMSICVKKYNSLKNNSDSVKLSKQLTEVFNYLYVNFVKNQYINNSKIMSPVAFDRKHFYSRFISIFESSAT